MMIEARYQRQRPVSLISRGRHDGDGRLLALEELLQHDGRVLVGEALCVSRQLLRAPAHLDAVAPAPADRLRHDGERQVSEGVRARGGTTGQVPGARHGETARFPQEGVHPVLVVVSIDAEGALAYDAKPFGVLAYLC